MTIKKSLVALGTAATVAIAGTGTGIANAATGEGDGTNPGDATLVSSAETALSNGALDPAGSVDFHNVLNPTNDDDAIDSNVIIHNLQQIAKGATALTAIAGSYVAVVNASDAFQGVVSDTQAFLESQGIL
jgi:hypothetical protein